MLDPLTQKEMRADSLIDDRWGVDARLEQMSEFYVGYNVM